MQHSGHLSQLSHLSTGNNGIVNYQLQEISYYVNEHQSFATQAAFIGGFTYLALRSTSLNEEISWMPSLDSIYSFFAGCTILLSVHVILCCLLLRTYGSRLSMYGRVGSMAKVAEVMKNQQPPIVRSYLFMLTSFLASTIALFWTVMDYTTATICTSFTAIAVTYWYYFSHRLYAQLSWTSDPSKDLTSEDGEDPVAKLQRLLRNQDQFSSYNSNVENRPFPEMTELTQKPSSTATTSTSPSGVMSALHSNNRNSVKSVASGGSSVAFTCLMEGYMTRKIIIANSRWERRYFILNGKGKIAIFKDRKEYRETGKSSLNEKPLPLEDYEITFDFSNASFANFASYPADVKDLLSSNEKKFFFLLVEKGEESRRSNTSTSGSSSSASKKFVFSCDTEEELLLWKAAIVNYEKDED